jgi:hypothetical protein
MNVLVALDRVILSLYQRLADRFELWTELTCFNAAKLSAISYLAFGLVIDFTMALRHPKAAGIWIMSAVVELIVYFLLCSTISSIERIARPGTRNFEETRWQFRLSATLFVVFLECISRHHNVLSVLSSIGFFSVFYFSSCTPLPPGARKTKKKKAEESHTALTTNQIAT